MCYDLKECIYFHYPHDNTRFIQGLTGYCAATVRKYKKIVRQEIKETNLKIHTKVKEVVKEMLDGKIAKCGDRIYRVNSNDDFERKHGDHWRVEIIPVSLFLEEWEILPPQE